MAEIWADKLVDLYKASIEEYRFNVRLNWDRTQYFLTLNLAIVGAATGLVKGAQTGPLEYVLIGSLFVCGIAASILAAQAAIKGHGYYRGSRAVLKAYETRLGCPPELALASTEGMKKGETPARPPPDLGEAGRAPPETYLMGDLRPGTVTYSAVVLLRFITALDIGGAVYAFWRARNG